MHLGYHELRNMLTKFREDRISAKTQAAPPPVSSGGDASGRSREHRSHATITENATGIVGTQTRIRHRVTVRFDLSSGLFIAYRVSQDRRRIVRVIT